MEPRDPFDPDVHDTVSVDGEKEWVEVRDQDWVDEADYGNVGEQEQEQVPVASSEFRHCLQVC